MPSKHGDAQDKHDTAMAARGRQSMDSRRRGRQVQTGKGRVGRPTALRNRSRR